MRHPGLDRLLVVLPEHRFSLLVCSVQHSVYFTRGRWSCFVKAVSPKRASQQRRALRIFGGLPRQPLEPGGVVEHAWWGRARHDQNDRERCEVCQHVSSLLMP